VRPDWHEPDEADVDVVIRGSDFDNAMGSGDGVTKPLASGREGEINVLITKEGEPVASVNLASLLGWASEQTPSE
jgi:hypothetical protein